MIPELPVGKTKEQRAAHAVEYAEYIERELLVELKKRRIHAEECSAPEWFLSIADIGVGRILHDVCMLREWARHSDPRSAACDIASHIYRVDEMLHNFINPLRVHPVRIKRAREWIAEGSGVSV
ncbi:TPA: hypothetical protein I7721_19100 [Vibrio vulnificus]|nr:hypothetical protein [Vibrio vulnificus]